MSNLETAVFNGDAIGDLPQDPFMPFVEPEGPSFLDTQACLCALRPMPSSDSNIIIPTSGPAIWQCIGNQTESAEGPTVNVNLGGTNLINNQTASSRGYGVYAVTSGKWFKATHGGTIKLNTTAIDDASNPPDLSNPQVWTSSNTFVTATGATSLSIGDQACTGINQTNFTTAFYRSTKAWQDNTVAADGLPCWNRIQPAVPLKIQNVSDWQQNGCMNGFLCENNTVNSLPQYCPPLEECQELRLSGLTCQLNGTYMASGPFEPLVCQEGFYCPPGGTQKLACPKGSYCQIGAATPTPCAVGSVCPEGSTLQRFLIPLAVLIVIDVILIAGIIAQKVMKRSRGHHPMPPTGNKPPRLMRSKTINAVRAVATGFVGGYQAVPDDPMTETEMMAMHATYMPGQNAWSGFYDAMAEAKPEAGGLTKVDHILETSITPQLRSFIESMRKATDAAHFGLSFQYVNLMFHPKASPRPILQNVTGAINRGTLAAVMGGSGAGKSTFVNVLMGKTANTGGTVMVNHSPGKIARYKKLIGYVPQDDIVLPELTVYENIMHSARIRLPRTWKQSEIEEHVTAVIDVLELSHVRDSLVGSVGKPVISGGQRKRVSIGMELAAAPMAIFLDEPTSGLDATSASSIMRTLQALARLGISVIVIIHQPRLEIWEMLDDLILLGNGQIIYEGRQVEVQRYFEGMGFSFPAHSNTGDIVTDIITGNGHPYKSEGDVSKEALIGHWAHHAEVAAEDPERAKVDKHASMASAAMNSSTSMHKLLRMRGAPRVKQAWLCLERAMLQQYRQKSAFWFEMGLASLAGLLLGLAMQSLKGEFFRGLYNAPYATLSSSVNYTSAPQLALLIAIAIGLVSAAPGVRVFSEEMLLHKREAEAGHSRIAYFMAKMVSVLPRMLLGCLHFTTLIMLLAVPVIPWGLAFLANLLYFYCIYGLASVISMIAKREDAPLLATMVALIVGILSGASPTLRSVASWHMEWLWRSSPGVWLAEIYFGQLVAPFRYLYQIDIAAEGTGFHLDWLWRNMLILFGIGTIYRIVAYLGLVLGQRLRRS